MMPESATDEDTNALMNRLGKTNYDVVSALMAKDMENPVAPVPWDQQSNVVTGSYISGALAVMDAFNESKPAT